MTFSHNVFNSYSVLSAIIFSQCFQLFTILSLFSHNVFNSSLFYHHFLTMFSTLTTVLLTMFSTLHYYIIIFSHCFQLFTILSSFSHNVFNSSLFYHHFLTMFSTLTTVLSYIVIKWEISHFLTMFSTHTNAISYIVIKWEISHFLTMFSSHTNAISYIVIKWEISHFITMFSTHTYSHNVPTLSTNNSRCVEHPVRPLWVILKVVFGI